MPAENVTVSATFIENAPETYAVTVGTLTNGTVTPSKTEAAAGEIITLTVTPADNYSIGEVKFNDTVITPVDGAYSFTMPADAVTVSATFIENAPETYTVTVGTLTNGTVTPDKTEAKAGDTVTLTVTPENGYYVKSVTVDDTDTTVEKSGTIQNEYSFVMPEKNITVTAVFEAIPDGSNIIEIGEAPAHGKISIDKAVAAKDETVTITVTPDSNYSVESVTVKDSDNNDVTVTPGQNNSYTFKMGEKPVKVTAAFVANGITLNAGEHGTLKIDNANPEVDTIVNVTITPEIGYKLKSLKVNDAYVTDNVKDGAYRFTYTGATVITAEFEKATYEITRASTSNGKFTVSKTTAEYGDVISISTDPNTGYKLKDITVNGIISKREIDVTNNRFTMPAENVRVYVTFTKKSTGSGGSSGGSGLGPAASVTPNIGSGIDGTVVSVTDDGASAVSGNTTLNASKVGNKINIAYTAGDDRDYVLVANDDTVIAKTVYNADSKSISSVVKNNGNYKVKAVEGLVFSDVSANDWYKKNVDFVTARGIMNGVGGSEFAPSATVTRAMVVATLQRMEDKNYSNTAVPFADVAADSWYAASVAWAHENGIVKGISETEFAPEAPVTREQLALILSNYVNYVASLSSDADLSAYVDSAAVSDWALSGVKSVVGLGIISGDDKAQLNPKGNASRAEYSTMLKRTIENLCK